MNCEELEMVKQIFQVMMRGAIKWIEIMKADIVTVDFPVYM